MKKVAICVMVAMLVALASVAVADDKGGEKAGTLFLFQKCDASLKSTSGHDAFGCPTADGPWPVYSGKNRRGVLKYTLWGTSFEFSFEGENLDAASNYTLIYYPDPWPGTNLVCLGSGKTNSKGKIKIQSKKSAPITKSLPQSGDANYDLGAKIWLVPTTDISCGVKMNVWNPTSYLFEYNPIVFELREAGGGDDDDDDDDHH